MVTTQGFLCDLHDYKLDRVILRMSVSESCYGTEFNLESTLYIKGGQTQTRSFPIYCAKASDSGSALNVDTWAEALELGSLRLFGLGGWYSPRTERTALLAVWNFVDELVTHHIPTLANDKVIDEKNEFLSRYRSLRSQYR